jgi:hypothetical protein
MRARSKALNASSKRVLVASKQTAVGIGERAAKVSLFRLAMKPLADPNRTSATYRCDGDKSRLWNGQLNPTALSAGCPEALDIENIQHGAIWYLPAGTLRHSLTQKALKLSKIINFCADVFDVMVSDLPHPGA